MEELTEQQRLDKFRKEFNKLAQKYGFDFQAQMSIVRLAQKPPGTLVKGEKVLDTSK